MTFFIPAHLLSGTNTRISTSTQSSFSFNISKCLLICMLLLGASAMRMNGATYTATGNGNWNASSTWGGTGFPIAGDIVNITNNYTITLTAPAACQSLTFGGNAGVLALGVNNLTINGDLTFPCNPGLITSTTGYVILNGTTQTITPCSGAGTVSIPNLRLTNNTQVSISPQGNLTITGNLDCQSGSSTFTNNTTGYGHGTLFITGTCTAPNCAFTVSNSNIGIAIDFSGCTSNPIQVGTVYLNVPSSTVTFGTKNVLTTTPFSGAYANTITYGSLTTVVKQYQSKQTGNWSNITTWNQSTDNGVTWVAATTTPTSSDGLVAIINGYTVTLTGNATASNLNITSGTLDVGTNTLTGSGAGTLAVASTGTLIVGGTTNFPTSFTTALSAGSTVNYDNNGAQTVSAQSYSNLTLSVSGAKTLLTGTTTIGGNLTLSGAATTATVVGLTIGGNLNIGDGTTFTAAGYTLTVNGTTNVGVTTSGILTISSTTGTKTFNGDVIINAGGTLNETAAATVFFGGSLTDNKTYTDGGGVHNFTGINKTIGCAPAITISLAQSNFSGTYTTTGNCSLYSLNITGSLTNNYNLGTTNLSGAGQLIQGVSALLLIGGPCTIYTLTATATGNTVQYFLPNLSIYSTNYYNLLLNGGGTETAGSGLTVLGNLTIGSGTTFTAGAFTHSVAGNWTNNGSFTNTGSVINFNGTTAQIIYGTTAFNHLIISNTATAPNNTVTLNNPISVAGVLVMTSGTLVTTATNLLTVTNTASTGISGGSATSFVNGPLAWNLPANLLTGSTYNFPVGTTSYLPFSLVNPTTSGSVTTQQVQAFNQASGGVNNVTAPLTSKSDSEYWFLTSGASLTGSSVSLGKSSSIYPLDAIGGSTTPTGTYSNLGGSSYTNGVNSSSAIGSDTYFVLAANNIPTISSALSLSGFNYIAGSGPSGEQTLTVSGTSLGSNAITVTPSTNFEIATLSGGIFQSTALTLTPVGGVVNTTLYVRMIAGNPVGTYGPENIVVQSTGASPKSVACSGYVIPLITIGGGGSYCINTPISLTSTSPNATNLYWEGPNNYFMTDQNNITVSTSATTAMSGIYTISANYTPPGNLVINGNFEAGMTGFNSDYTPKSPTGGNQVLYPEGSYTVVANPNTVHDKFGTWPDHTPTGTLQMVINGATVAGVKVWYETVNVTPNTNYQFTYWIQSMALTGVDAAPSQLQLYATGNVSPIVPAGPTYTAIAAGGQEEQFVYNWNSGPNTTVTLSLVNKQTQGGGNDFSLDDIVFQQVYSSTASVNVTVIPSPVAPTVSIAASPGTSVNSGTSVTFTATPTNGGTTPSYQWNVNGVNAGTNSPVFTTIPSNGDIIKCTLTSSSTCNAGVTTASAQLTMTVTAVVNYWKGTNGTNWGDPTNWTVGVPATGDNVIFAAKGNSAGVDASSSLILDGDRIIGNLTNMSPVSLIIPPAKSLTVNGSITTLNAGSIIIKAYPDGSEQNGTLIFSNAANVPGTVEMYARGSKIAGETYNTITYHYTWQYFGIPVSQISASPTFNGSYVRRWDQTGSQATHWIQLGNGDQLSPFIGYELTQQNQGIIIFQGTLQNGNYTSPVKLIKTGTAAFPGQYIFANPYTAAIDVQKFLTDNSGNDNDGAVYLYNSGSYADWGTGGLGAIYGSNPGQYQVVTKTSGIGLPTQIPSMQAVLIQVVNGNQNNSVVTFNYSNVLKNNSLQRSKELLDSASITPSLSNVYTMIDVKGSTYTDRMWIFSDPSFTKNYDKGWDGTKMLGIPLVPQLYALEGDGAYQIDCVNDMNNTLLGFQRGGDTLYTFTFTHINTGTRYAGIYLQDLVENKIIDITASGTQYTFEVDSTTIYNNRFRIITRDLEQNILTGNNPTLYNPTDYNSKIKIFTVNGDFFVQNLSNEKGEFSLFDMAGRNIFKTTFAPNNVTKVGSLKQSGIYIGSAAISTEKSSQRFIIRNE